MSLLVSVVCIVVVDIVVVDIVVVDIVVVDIVVVDIVVVDIVVAVGVVVGVGCRCWLVSLLVSLSTVLWSCGSVVLSAHRTIVQSSNRPIVQSSHHSIVLWRSVVSMQRLSCFERTLTPGKQSNQRTGSLMVRICIYGLGRRDITVIKAVWLVLEGWLVNR